MGFYTGINFSFVCYRLMRYLERHVKAFFNLVVLLLVLAVVVLVTRYAFVCPCLVADDALTVPVTRVVYGSLFIGVPPFILWLGGILMHESTWRCITGWRAQKKFTYPCRSCVCFWYTLFASSLSPLAWLIFVFLEGSYLPCVLSTVPDTCDASVTPPPDLQEQNLDYRVQSQIIGCGIAGGAFLLYFCMYLLTQCCGSMTYYQKKYGREVNTLEEEAFEDAFKEYYNEEFKAKWKAMFNEGAQADWQFVSELPPKNASKKMYYSPFHAWKSGQIAPFPRSQPVPDKLVTVTVRSGGEWEVNKCAEAAKLDDAEAKAKLSKSLKAQESRSHTASQQMTAMVPQAGHPGHLPPLTYPGAANGYPSHHARQSPGVQQQKQQGLYTPRQPAMPAPQPMSDDPDEEEPPVIIKKKSKKKKSKKSQVQSMEMHEGPDPGESYS